MNEPLMTARAIADELGLSTETVLRWTRRGEIPAIRLPSGAIRYRATAIAGWLASHEIQSSNDLGPAANGPQGKESDAGAHPPL